MIVYLSGLQKEYCDFAVSFGGFGALASFAYPEKYFEYKNYNFPYLMLDSGAFSVFKTKKEIDIDAYIDFIKTNSVKIVINLDVIGGGEGSQKSFDNWQYMLSKGVECIPVWHHTDDMKYLHKYVEKSEYVGLGIHSTNMRRYLDKIFSIYLDHKFHLFACASIPILTTYPAYSADSTSWQNGTRMGWVITRYGNFFLNNNKNVPADVEEFLRAEYNLLSLADYESTSKFGEAINRVNISELNYLLCNSKAEFNKSTNMELF